MTQAALFARMTLAVMALMLGLSLPSPRTRSAAPAFKHYGVEQTQTAQGQRALGLEQVLELEQKWNASGFWEAGLGYMQSDGAGERNIWDVGFTPVHFASPRCQSLLSRRRHRRALPVR
jgi:hypothetical protein